MELRPDYDSDWYNLACAYALLGKESEALESLQKSIELNPGNKKLARKDSDFDSIRESEGFKRIINQ